MTIKCGGGYGCGKDLGWIYNVEDPLSFIVFHRKLQCLSNNQKLMLLEKLKRKTELYLTDQIKSCILNKETM